MSLFKDRLRELRIESGRMQKTLAEQLGINLSTYKSYEYGKAEPDSDVLLNMARIFNVSVDYLIGLEDIKNPLDPEHLVRTAREDYLLSIFRDLDTQYQDSLIENAETLKKLNETNAAHLLENYIEPRFFGRVSAGTGHMLMEDFTDETIKVKKSNLTGNTDYVIQVEGNSMKPKFKNGDYLLVQKQQTVDDGEIGIFWQDGETYIKQKRGNVLHSLNPRYKDIVINDDTRCFGKVLGIAQIIKDN